MSLMVKHTNNMVNNNDKQKKELGVLYIQVVDAYHTHIFSFLL